MTKEEIALILKNLRIKAGLTQKEAAEKLGRKQQTLASWEIGQSQPDANTLFVLCSIYGVSIDSAFGFEKHNPTKNSPLCNEVLEIFNSLDDDLQDFAINQLNQLLILQNNKIKLKEQ